MKTARFYNSATVVAVNANGLKCISLLFGDVSCGRARRTSSSHLRSMASEEHGQIIFSGKTTTRRARTSETRTCGTPIFLPSHSSRGSTYLSALLFDEDPGNNGNGRRRRYLLPPIFRMVENRFARARGIGVAEKEVKRDRREEEDRIGPAKDSGRETERSASMLLCGPL